MCYVETKEGIYRRHRRRVNDFICQPGSRLQDNVITHSKYVNGLCGERYIYIYTYIIVYCNQQMTNELHTKSKRAQPNISRHIEITKRMCDMWCNTYIVWECKLLLCMRMVDSGHRTRTSRTGARSISSRAVLYDGRRADFIHFIDRTAKARQTQSNQTMPRHKTYMMLSTKCAH